MLIFFARRRREKIEYFDGFQREIRLFLEVKHAIFSLRRRRRAQKSVKIGQNPGFRPILADLRFFEKGGGVLRGFFFYQKLH